MPDKDSKCICCSCGELLAHSKYYKSNSEFYKSGYLPICKECFSRKFGNYASEYGSNKKAMQRMCIAFDVYYNEELFNKCDTDDNTVIGNYFRMLNMSQNKGKTFDSTIKDGFELFNDKKSTKEVRKQVEDDLDDESEIPKKYISNWGYGLGSIQDYETLDAHYKYLKEANPNCDSNQEIFINDLCYIKMQQMRAVRNGEVDNYSKLTESYRKSFTQAGLKTVRDMSETEDFTIGVNIETIEKYTPAEYYKDKTLFKDFDGIGDYFKRAVLRPLKNAFLGTNERDDEYCIKSDGDDYEVTE